MTKSTRLVLLAVLLLTGCATTTPREKVQTGVTQIAFGAPLVLSASMGLTLMAVLAAVDAADRGILIDEPVYIGPVVLAGAILVTGSTLVAVGSASLSEGLDEMATRNDARRVDAAAVEDAAKETRRQLKKEEPKQWYPDD